MQFLGHGEEEQPSAATELSFSKAGNVGGWQEEKEQIVVGKTNI